MSDGGRELAGSLGRLARKAGRRRRRLACLQEAGLRRFHSCMCPSIFLGPTATPRAEACPVEHRRTLLAAGNSVTSFPPICVTSGPVRHSAMQTRGVGRRWQDGGHLSLIIRRRTTKASSLDPLLPPPQPPRIIDDDAQQSPPSPPVSSLCRPKTPCLSSSVS